jgi:hypothetical protein
MPKKYQGEASNTGNKQILIKKRRTLTKLWAEMVKDGRPVKETDAVKRRIDALKIKSKPRG